LMVAQPAASKARGSIRDQRTTRAFDRRASKSSLLRVFTPLCVPPPRHPVSSDRCLRQRQPDRRVHLVSEVAIPASGFVFGIGRNIVGERDLVKWALPGLCEMAGATP
jgi:hypothetical protein